MKQGCSSVASAWWSGRAIWLGSHFAIGESGLFKLARLLKGEGTCTAKLCVESLHPRHIQSCLHSPYRMSKKYWCTPLHQINNHMTMWPRSLAESWLQRVSIYHSSTRLLASRTRPSQWGLNTVKCIACRHISGLFLLDLRKQVKTVLSENTFRHILPFWHPYVSMDWMLILISYCLLVYFIFWIMFWTSLFMCFWAVVCSCIFKLPLDVQSSAWSLEEYDKNVSEWMN